MLQWLITLPTRSAMLSRPRNGRRSRRVAAVMGARSFSGGGQQLTAFAGPLGGQHGVVAAHQPLAGKVRRVDSTRSWVSNSGSCSAPSSTRALIWGARNALIHSNCAGRISSRNMGVGEHAPIAHQAHPGKLEKPGLELGDLGGQGFRVGGAALEHLMAIGIPAGEDSSP